MSQKGAIKKTTESKNVSKIREQMRTKSRHASDAINEISSLPEPKDPKISVLKNSKQLKTSSSSSSKPTGSRISSSDKLASLQTKSVRHNGRLSSSRSSAAIATTIASTPRYESRSTNKTTSSGTRSDRQKVELEKRLKTVPATGAIKSKEKPATIYLEKRGTSSIYLPKTARSSIAIASKNSGQIGGTKRSSVSNREKEKIGKTDSIDKTATKSLPRVSSRERRRSRTLSPSEVKFLHSVTKNGNTLNNGRNKKENSSEKPDQKLDTTANDEAEKYDYEDDFEDYESDFQECTDSEISQISEEQRSSDSPEPEPIEMQKEEQIKPVNSADGRRSDGEHMLDSGHYELTEARKRAAQIESMSIVRSEAPPLPELRQTVNRAYRQEKTSENKSLPNSSTDEGFEDGRSGDFAKSPPLSQISFIDFQKPKQKRNEKKMIKKSKRGEELLNMIKLDNVGWSLIEHTPIAYEEFIKNYGSLNTQQISLQTNEDNLDAEIQTEIIESSNKWTQFPIACKTNLKTAKDVKIFKMEQIGVGGDIESDETNLPKPSYDILKLNEFLSGAGRVMLSLLEERKVGGNFFQRNSHEFPFSEGFIKLAVDSVSFLVNRKVSFIHYSDTLNKILLTIHGPNNEGIETPSKEDYLTDCCIGCVWSTSEPSKPMKLFYSPCPITACCFHSMNHNVVFAGLQDGSINLWDLREDEMWHQKVTDKVNGVDWVLRSPTYTTADSSSENYHNSEIVSIKVISHIDRDESNGIKCRLAPIQICTLDEQGELIVWSVLYTMGIRLDDLGLAPWGDVRLQISQRVCLDYRKDETQKIFTSFFDMHVDSVDTNNLFLATNSNNILHATCIGNKVAPKIYRGNEMEYSGVTKCIEGFPFKQSYFLVGCDDGTIRLHSLRVERALLQLKDEECKSAIKSVQWSKSKPFTIFVLDSASKIHIWDLGNSDIFPIYTISTMKWGCITSMQLSPCRSDRDMINQYLALGTDDGRIEIHKLKEDFCYVKKTDADQELDMFLRYVNIL